MAFVIGVVLGVYGLASVGAFAAYWWDKRAALRGGWRVSEGALHAFSLAGGFFGALVAQRVLRHKRRKRGFMVVYWMTVGVHAVGWVAAWWVVSGGG